MHDHRPPAHQHSPAGEDNLLKRLRSRNGVTITLDDHDGEERLLLETPAGQKITLADGARSVRIEDSSGNSIVLESSGITIRAVAKVSVVASQVQVSAGVVEIDAGMTKVSGTLQCDTLIASSVVASSYAPGAGNVW
jgi:hypothetical protein